MNLKLLRDDVLIDRFKELSKKYFDDTIEMEKFLEQFQQVRIELLLLEQEIADRNLSDLIKAGETS